MTFRTNGHHSGRSQALPWHGRLAHALSRSETVRRNSPLRSGAWAGRPCHIETAALILLLLATAARAQVPAPPPPTETTPAVLSKIGIDQKLDAQVPGDLVFKDENGRAVRLGDYYGKRPFILALVYFKCPMLCTLVLNDLLRSLNGLTGMSIGQQFDVLTVSFDPKETPELAAAKKTEYLREYGRRGAADGWHFLTGSPESIKAITDAVGFRYSWDPQYQQFVHASGLMILTPEGKVSRYFYGIDYAPTDLRLSLVEASHNKIGSATDEILLYCFHYDPRTGKYGLIINRVIQLSGALTILVLGTFLFFMFRSDAKKRTAWAAIPGGNEQIRTGGGTL